MELMKVLFEGDLEFYETTLDGRHCAYGIKRYKDVRIKGFYIETWYRYAYCSFDSRPTDYIKTVQITYKKYSLQLEIYKNEKGDYYAQEPTEGWEWLIEHGMYLPIAFDHFLEGIDLDPKDVIPVESIEYSGRFKGLVGVGDKIRYTDELGIERLGEVLDVLSVHSYRNKNGEVRYEGDYLLQVIE